jgi:hypothetical protein
MHKDRTLDEVIFELRSLNESVPNPMRLPTKEEVSNAELEIGFEFHPDYRKYLLEASDVIFGVIEPATLTIPGCHTDLHKISRVAWKNYSLPKNLLPICQDNADFYCMNKLGEVIFWSHNGWTNVKWPNLASWIDEIWIGGL